MGYDASNKSIEFPIYFLFIGIVLLLQSNVYAELTGIDRSLPVHQSKKIHPELGDPVLGDNTQIVEWAWSPQYAKRFGLEVQPDGLPDGGLWLIGIKIQRQQHEKWQRYTCNIVGLIDNKLPILTPPVQYSVNPGNRWLDNLPGKIPILPVKNGLREYTPTQSAWYRKPKNKNEEKFSERGITVDYISFYKYFTHDLAYFEIDGACSYFNDPALFRNQIRFPVEKPTDPNGTTSGKPSAMAFDFPEGLMSRIYPYTVDADDWTSCFMKRINGRQSPLSWHAHETNRFENKCQQAR